MPGGISPPWPQINAPEEFATNIMDTMVGVMNNALNIASGIQDPTINLDFVDSYIPPIISTPIDFNMAWQALQDLINKFPVTPVFGSIDTSTATLGTIQTLPDITLVDVPDFTVPMPSVSFMDSPTWTDPGVVPTEPLLNTYPAPTKPVYSFPTAPVLSAINLPTPLPIDIPIFDATLLDEDLLTPTNIFNFNEELYTSELKDAVYNGLYDMVINGGYGLNPNDETLLFDRSREKEVMALQSVIDESKKQFAITGFILPPGALAGAARKATQEMSNKVSSINRDLVLKRADMYIDMKKFTYQQAIQLESILINLHNSIQERALNAQKAQMEIIISIFNAEITRYKAKQERFLALAEVFKDKIQAEMLKVEIYKAQMEGAKVGVEINRSYVSLYSEQIHAIGLILDAYKTDVEAFKTLSEVEKLKIDIFRAEIDAYATEIQANKTRFEAYTASINGELAKVETYKAQAQAYASIIEGKKDAIQAMVARLTAYIETNKNTIDVFRAQVEEKKGVRDAQIAFLNGQTEVFKAEVSAFDAEVNGASKIYEVGIQARELEYKTQLQALTLNVEVAKLYLEKVVKQATLLVEIEKTKSELWSKLASAAMSAMNVHTGLSEGYSNSNTWSYDTRLVANVDETVIGVTP